MTERFVNDAAETASLRGEIEKLKNKLIPKQQKVNEVESKIRGFESELSVLISERDGKRNELETAQNSLTLTLSEVDRAVCEKIKNGTKRHKHSHKTKTKHTDGKSQ